MQLTLDGCLLGGSSRKLLDILRQRMLHRIERVAQQLDLVIMFDNRQLCVEVSLGHLIGRDRQLLERSGGPADGDIADMEDNHQPNSQQQQRDTSYHNAHKEDGKGRHDDSHRPASLL